MPALPFHIPRWALISALILSFAGWSGAALGQENPESAQGRLRRAEELHRGYDFPGAVAICEELLSDPSVQGDLRRSVSFQRERSVVAEDLQTSCRSLPRVARKRFSRAEFLFYYPLPDRSWHDIILPDGSKARTSLVRPFTTMLFSAPDETGVRNIYRSAVVDTLPAAPSDSLRSRGIRPGDFLWSAPSLLGGSVTGYSNEDYPMLSADGKTLYFASDGFGGMGGYDLFESKWDEKTSTWGEPRNMGFPFNSPADDFLLMSSQDGKYFIFASDRDCPADSVNVYVLGNEAAAGSIPLFTPQDLRDFCSLDPDVELSVLDNSALFSGRGRNWSLVERFSSLYGKVRVMGERVSAKRRQLDSLRAQMPQDGLPANEEGLSELESSLRACRDSLSAYRRSLSEVERAFMAENPSLNTVALTREADRDIQADESGYVFSRMTPGEDLSPTFEPQPRGDFYIFSPTATEEDLREVPNLLYRIKFLSVRPGDVQVSRAMPPGPVRKTVGSSGREEYYCGMFGRYEDALGVLNSVRALGYPDAEVTGWLAGSEVTLERAREALLSVHELFHLRIYPQDGKSLSGIERTVLDIVIPTGVQRNVKDGTVSYVTSDYDTKEEALSLKMKLEERGLVRTDVESSGMSVPK